MSRAEPYRDRLARVGERLDRQHRQVLAGITAPDPATGERWDPGQVWAHLSEFIPYWIDQAEIVIAGPAPAPFGRTKRDPVRIATIEERRHDRAEVLWERLRNDITTLDEWLAARSDSQWDLRGVHPTLGEMDLGAIVDEFLVGHLEEHADQLASLEAADGAAPA